MIAIALLLMCVALWRRLARHLGEYKVDLSHFGVGAMGARAVAEALRQNPPLKCLVLADNWLFEDGGTELSRCVYPLFAAC